VCKFGSKGEKGREGNIRAIFEEGETLQYRSTGRLFALKKRTDPFVVFQSLDGLTQVLTEEKNIFDFFEIILRGRPANFRDGYIFHTGKRMPKSIKKRKWVTPPTRPMTEAKGEMKK
jgi:hypothetical protein